MIVKEKLTEGGHWYTPKGEPFYTMMGANGEQRNTTLRDARKLGLLPSVTTINNMLAKAGLNSWLQQQVLLAALTLPRLPNEFEEDWLKRVMSDSKATGRDAADRGTRIHAIVQSHFEGVKKINSPPYIANVEQALKEAYGDQHWLAEKSFAHPLGYGGKCDLMCPNGLVVDFKTKDTPLDKVDVYFEHEMQLAAYREGLGMPSAKCAIVFINGTTNEVKLIKIEDVALQKSWECFQHLLRVYQIKNGI
jgi:hypothetical protein